ncbi:MAG: prepilin-type N-terminal cleavage/methylation domain-containing protein [Bacillota bacterium]
MMRMWGTGRNECRGFTLLEVVVALVLIALAAALMMPDLGKMEKKQKLEQIKNQLTEDLILLRNEAVSNNDEARVEFFPDRKCYVFILGEERFERSLEPFAIELVLPAGDEEESRLTPPEGPQTEEPDIEEAAGENPEEEEEEEEEVETEELNADEEPAEPEESFQGAIFYGDGTCKGLAVILIYEDAQIKWTCSIAPGNGQITWDG